MKIRVLFCTEASYLNTGYATYARELLLRLHQIPQLDVAEFACYAYEDDPKIYTVPWKLYCNAPNSNNKQAVQEYESNPINHFGAWRFEEVCLDFKPHIVLSIRDFWMESFIDTSPFRKYFKWVWMPTVDAEPQHEQWLDMFARCDAILTYTDWSGETLLKQAGKNINWQGEAPPVVSDIYRPLDKAALKKNLGFTDDTVIFGTVMRNQRRKLFPDLFKCFRAFLDNTGSKDTYLYCHTSYPDNGWDIPELLKTYRLSAKTLFTYVCKNKQCNHVFPSFFADAVQGCLQCHQLSAVPANVETGAPTEIMANIYNLFDFYIQYANSEGFGIPLAEAGACGVPVIAVDYSAMSDIVRKLKGFPIPVAGLTKEQETGCNRAVPDNTVCVRIMEHCYNLRKKNPVGYLQLSNDTAKLYRENYDWRKTLQKWVNCFNQFPMPDDSQTWNSPPKIHNIPTQIPNIESNSDYAKWLIAEVLGEPERLNSYMEMRMVKDLNYGKSPGGFGGMYYNDAAHTFQKINYHDFTRQDAYNQMKNLCERRNYYESRKVRT